MTVYQFIDVDSGEGVELDFTFDTVPSIGRIVRRAGRNLKRVFSTVRGEHITTQRSKYPYLSHSHTPWMPGCETAKDPRSGKLKPIIQSRQHERELCDRHGLVKE